MKQHAMSHENSLENEIPKHKIIQLTHSFKVTSKRRFPHDRYDGYHRFNRSSGLRPGCTVCSENMMPRTG